jgi:hypothetical protein
MSASVPSPGLCQCIRGDGARSFQLCRKICSMQVTSQIKIQAVKQYFHIMQLKDGLEEDTVRLI